MPTPPEVLRDSLARHNATFETLLQFIPAQYYIVEDNEDLVSVWSCFLGFRNSNMVLRKGNAKYQKNRKKEKAPKQAIKEASKKAKRDKVSGCPSLVVP